MSIKPSITLLLSPTFIYASMKLIKSKQCLNLDLANDLVNMFAGFSSDATFSTMISFVSIMSLTKCKRMSMCFCSFMIYLMISQMNGTLAITMYLHKPLTNLHFSNHTFQSYGFLDPFNKGNVLCLSC